MQTDSTGAAGATPEQRVAQLLEDIGKLDSTKDGELLLAKYDEAASLVDRKQKPLKWAALREMYGAVAFNLPPRREAALQAFRDSLPYWDPVTQRAQWAECKSYIGWTLFALGRHSPPDSEEAIECLEATLVDYPDGTAEQLATYYGARTVGDPFDNWKKWVGYLAAALAQLSAQNEPTHWARLRNEQANALRREPSGDFAQGVEMSITYHHEALAVLTPAVRQSSPQARALWIRISIDASEAYMSRVGGSRADNLSAAQQLAHDALAACSADTPRDTHAFAAMAVARVLLDEDAAPTANQCAAALASCASVDALFGAAVPAAIAATNWRFKALAYLRLVKLGQAVHLEDLVAAVEAACALLDPSVDASTIRVVTRIAADALVLRGEHARAIGYLKRAQAAGESSLEHAQSRAGRLECIFNLHDVSALLGFCLLVTGDVPAGVEAIDRNKGRFWHPDRIPVTYAEIRQLVPEHGALIVPSFGPNEACVVVITRGGEQTCRLEGFGLAHLHDLLLKDLHDPGSDAWMSRYVFRHSRPDRWSARIDEIGGLLFERFWSPVLTVVAALGVADGGELLCFPQAGLGVLPLHAAWAAAGNGRRWLGERFAIRYAPSARCLLQRQTTDDGSDALSVARSDAHSTVLVSNPPTPYKDLPYAALEMALVRAEEPAETLRHLSGAEATRAAVLAALGSARLMHFATHGVFNVVDPFLSSLVLAEGELLSLDVLLPAIEHSKVRHVVLSACETAVVSSWRRADEMIGFPAAFLEHGASTVLATLWPVDDLAAALMVGRFYREWRGSPSKTAARALQAAQNWLREASSDSLYESLTALVGTPDPLGGLVGNVRTQFYSMDPDDKPFAHPQYWAAFMISGL